LRDVGMKTYPYPAYVPSFGEWGFVLASPQQQYVPPTSYRLPMRFLNAVTTREVAEAMAAMLGSASLVDWNRSLATNYNN
jgi:predicted membrane-bound spermidine synthase